MKHLFKLIVVTLVLMGGTLMSAQAGDVSDPTAVAITIYNEDLALIREQREFTLAGGTESVSVSDVSGKLDPTTVHLSFADGFAFSLLEQNFDYDLVSSDTLLQKFIGRDILLIDDTRKTEIKGKLLATSGGVVIQTAEGQILLNAPGRAVLPPGAASELLLKPTLSWMLYSAQGGNHTGELMYLSGGLSWRADYVILLNADDTAGDVEGWVTISNNSGTTFKDARLKLVAGDVNRVREEQMLFRNAGAVAIAPPAPAGFQEEQFFEYHLYDLQRPTTIRNNQIKQIGLLTAASVPMKKLLGFDGINGGKVQVQAQFKNEEAAGMGMPLPKGTIRVFKGDKSGAPQFVGEDRIDHTPKDEKVTLDLGSAFDIVGETKRTAYEDLKSGWNASYEVLLKNHKESEDVVVTVYATQWGDWKITDSSLSYTKKDATTVEFAVPVKAGGETKLTFSLRMTRR